MMAVYYAGIVLTEKDGIKDFPPCKRENKHSLTATDQTTRFVHVYSAL